MSAANDFDLDGCDAGLSYDPCRENWDSNTSPQVKLEYLKEALKQRIEQLQAQEGITKELEDELRKTREDLTILKEKYENSDNLSDEIVSFLCASDVQKNFVSPCVIFCFVSS